MVSLCILTRQDGQHHGGHHVVNETGKQQIVVFDNSVSVVSGRDKERAQHQSRAYVHHYPEMRQCLFKRARGNFVKSGR